jgi:hypothetical protein
MTATPMIRLCPAMATISPVMWANAHNCNFDRLASEPRFNGHAVCVVECATKGRSFAVAICIIFLNLKLETALLKFREARHQVPFKQLRQTLHWIIRIRCHRPTILL